MQAIPSVEPGVVPPPLVVEGPDGPVPVVEGAVCAFERRFALFCTAKKPIAENPLKTAIVASVKSIFPRVSIYF